MDYGLLSPRAKREVNLQRQQLFFDGLLEDGFARAPGDLQRIAKVEGQLATGEQSAPAHVEEDPREILARLAPLLPGRERELIRVLAFLSLPFHLGEALQVSGGAGAGKTAVLEAALQAVRVPHCNLLCSGFSKMSQLFGSICCAIDNATSTKTTDYSRLPATLEAFLSALAEVDEDVILFLDRVDAADSLQPGLARKLLALPQLCGNPRVRVVAACATVIPGESFRLVFQPYSDSQLESILLLRSANCRSVAELVSTALPRLLLYTRHIDLLWTVLRAMADKPPDPLKAESTSCRVDMSVERALHGAQETVLSLDWTRSAPASVRCILLAAFCAASNAKSTDAYTFGFERRGRRKARGASSSSDRPDGGGGGHSFSLERLSSIFIQIASEVGAAAPSDADTKSRAGKRDRTSAQREAVREVVGTGEAFVYASVGTPRMLGALPSRVDR